MKLHNHCLFVLYLRLYGTWAGVDVQASGGIEARARSRCGVECTKVGSEKEQDNSVDCSMLLISISTSWNLIFLSLIILSLWHMISTIINKRLIPAVTLVPITES